MAYKTGRKVNPNKLLNSKWTAVFPQHREKHFIIIKLIHDDNEDVQGCVIEAVINQRQQSIEWRELLDHKVWKQGWC